MTLICTSRDVDKLIGEIRCWDDDPDLRRIADAIPLNVLEAAYVAKLDALPAEPIPDQAATVRQKVTLLRTVLATWMRHPKWRLGQLLVNSVELSMFYVKDEAFARSFKRALSYTSDE